VFFKKTNTQFNNISYPSSKAFGKWAWCIRDKEKAMQKLMSL
jgi:hypothetical protein